jgi:hypothetical protein
MPIGRAEAQGTSGEDQGRDRKSNPEFLGMQSIERNARERRVKLSRNCFGSCRSRHKINGLGQA